MGERDAGPREGEGRWADAVWEKRTGPAQKERKEMGRGERRGGLGRLGCFAGLGWIAKGFGFSISYLFSISYFKPNSTYLNQT